MAMSAGCYEQYILKGFNCNTYHETWLCLYQLCFACFSCVLLVSDMFYLYHLSFDCAKIDLNS